MELLAPELLEPAHNVADFDCGKEELNTFLKRFALTNQGGGTARTYVVVGDGRVVGYFSLAPAGVDPLEAPERVMKGQAKHPVPCILLARLAVDKSAQGLGLGKFLFREALLRAFQAHQQIGGRAFLVHAMDEDARAFYERYGMAPSPTHPLHLFLLFKDVRFLLEQR